MNILLPVMLRGGRVVAVMAVLAGALTGLATMAMISVITSSIGASSTPAMMATFALSGLIVLASGAIASNALVRVTQRSIDRLRTQVVDDLTSTTLRAYERYGTAKAMATLTDDLATVGQAVQALPLLLINVVIVVSAGIYIASLSLPALGLLLVTALVGVAAYAWAGSRADVHMRRARELQDELHGWFQALTHGMKDLKLDRGLRSQLIEDRLNPDSEELAARVVRGSTIGLVTGYWGQLLFLACIGVIVFAGGWLGVGTREQFALTLAVLYMNTPLVTVLNIMPVLGRAKISLERLQDVRELRTEAETRVVSEAPEVISEVALEKAGFGYEAGLESFRVGPVSHTFRRGTVTFIVGGNGSGKSTLGKLVAGLYAPDSGLLRVDGVALDAAGTIALRERVSAVFVDSYPFDIVRRVEPDEVAKLREWLTTLGLNSVEIVDGRLCYDGLSSGQLKRLALAQVLAAPRDLILLDEWAAEQDPTFREHFYTTIVPGLRRDGRIVVVISHDDRYFSVADSVLKLERGSHIETYQPTST